MYGGIGFGIVIIPPVASNHQKGTGGDNLAGDAFANAAFDQQMGGMVGMDAGISPEQLQYEQQLLAAGYTPKARAYRPIFQTTHGPVIV